MVIGWGLLAKKTNKKQKTSDPDIPLRGVGGHIYGQIIEQLSQISILPP